MRRYNLTPFQPAFVLERMLADMTRAAGRAGTTDGPRYDVVRHDDDRFELVIAVPGYDDAAIEINEEDGRLTIAASGNEALDKDDFVRRGIARAGFQLAFALPEHVTAKAGRLNDGLLHIELERVVPEHLRPRRIAIGPQTDKQAAA